MSDEKRCGEEATARMHWPGRDETAVCAEHHQAAVYMANVMGFYLPFSEPQPGDVCQQKVTKR